GSGVTTVDVGQAEAARAIGLSFLPTARLVIMPQAFRGAIAPLGNTFIALIKNTTVAAAISVDEVAMLMKAMIEAHGNLVIPIFLAIAAGFVVIVIPVGLATTLLSQRLAVPDERTVRPLRCARPTRPQARTHRQHHCGHPAAG